MADRTEREYDHQQIELLRENMKGITAKLLEQRLAQDLEPQEKLELYKFAYQLQTSPFWLTLIKEVTTSQLDLSVMKAENYDIVTFGRATVNGVLLLDELLTKFVKHYNANEPPEDEEEEPNRSPVGLRI